MSPVKGVAVGSRAPLAEGSLLVSGDKAGVIYRITYEGGSGGSSLAHRGGVAVDKQSY